MRRSSLARTLMRHPTAVLFDLDGIATEQQKWWWDACGVAFARHGMHLSDDDLLAAAQHHLYVEAMLQPFMQSAAEAEIAALAKVLRQEIAPLYEAHIDSKCLGWRAGALETIGTVSRTVQSRIAVVTASRNRHIDRMPLAGLRNAFPVWVTSDDTDHLDDGKKPKPGGLRLAMERLHAVAPVTEEIGVYIGDMLTDMQAAYAAGMAGILLPGPYTHPEAGEHATIVLDRITDLPDALEEIARRQEPKTLRMPRQER